MKILLAGDSTVAACPALETPMSGWGAHLGSALNARLGPLLLQTGRLSGVRAVPVLNVARGGATTMSFRTDGLWAALLDQAADGDGVLFQFGHNDQKNPALAARGRYRDNLADFVAETRTAGCWPVLCTPVVRRAAQDRAMTRLDPQHGDYPAAVRELAAELRVPLIDLTMATLAVHRQLGSEGSRNLFTQYPAGVHPLYPDGIEDNTHYSFTGATIVADLVAQELAPLVMDQLVAADARRSAS